MLTARRLSLLLVVAFLAGGAPAMDAWNPDPGLPGGVTPGEVPILLAPGLVNTGVTTRDATLTPDGKEMYFCMAGPGYGRASIMVTRFVDGGWTEPETAPFSGATAWIDLEPFVAPDGRRLFFMSTRPAPGEQEGEPDIWVTDRRGDTWSEPRPLGEPVNTDLAEYFPAVTMAGDLYFTRADSTGRIHQVFRSRLADGAYQEPELLPEQVNCGTNRFNATISADASRLIVPAAGVPGSHGGVDYFLVRRNPDDTWEAPVNLGPVVNDGSGQSWSPYLTPDGRFFLFMSSRRSVAAPAWPPSWGLLKAGHMTAGGGNPAIHAVDAAFLDHLPGRVPESPEPADLPPVTPAAWPELTGLYLGQEPPGVVPELFAPGIVSTGMNERDLTVSADGRTIWFGFMGQGLVTVLETRLAEGSWTEPVPVPFHRDGSFFCFEPALAADGNRVFFLSNRAAPGQEQGTGWTNQNIFTCRREGAGWTEPAALPAPVTTEAAEYFPSLAADGTLYFTREDEDGSSVWRAEPAGDGFGAPVRLPAAVNLGSHNYNATVAPDESWLIVCVAGHEDNLGRTDFWISFRSSDGKWAPGVNMGEVFNAPGARASSVSVSPDGRYLFFSTSRTITGVKDQKNSLKRYSYLQAHAGPGNGSTDVWWVDIQVINGFK
jgi:hypothetical protein